MSPGVKEGGKEGERGERRVGEREREGGREGASELCACHSFEQQPIALHFYMNMYMYIPYTMHVHVQL